MINSENFEHPWMRKMDKESGELIWAVIKKTNAKSILDAGCGTCVLYDFLIEKGWEGIYYGIDIKRYEGVDYSRENLYFIKADLLKVDFPKVDVVVMKDILEHVDEPIKLLKKALKCSKRVVLFIPLANPDLWKMGICEYHQLDKTHKHFGFLEEDIFEIVNEAGGEIISFAHMCPLTPLNCSRFFKSRFAKYVIFVLMKILGYRKFYQEMFLEIEGKNGNRA